MPGCSSIPLQTSAQILLLLANLFLFASHVFGDYDVVVISQRHLRSGFPLNVTLVRPYACGGEWASDERLHMIDKSMYGITETREGSDFLMKTN